MLQSVTECYRVLQSVTEIDRVVVIRGLLDCGVLEAVPPVESIAECYRVLQSVTKCYRVLQSVTECYRVLQSITEYYKLLQSISSASTWTNFWACFFYQFHQFKEKVMYCKSKRIPLSTRQ